MITRRTTLALLGSSIALPAFASSPQVFQTNSVAINGIDPVAYFALSGPVAGSASHAVSWMGATWQFASAENRDLFASSPEQYAPKYGGYCAYAASKGYLAPTMPEAWTVYQNTLYLNANLRARELWLQDKDGNIAAADGHWPRILS